MSCLLGAAHAVRRGRSLSIQLSPLTLSIGMQRQGVDARLHFVAQDAVHLLMAPYFTLTFKSVTHKHHFEMAFRPWRHRVHIAFIDNFQMQHRQTLCQLLLNTFFHGHLNDSLTEFGRVMDSPETSKAFLHYIFTCCLVWLFKKTIIVQKMTHSHRHLHW